jgi:hypothetical protein
MKSTRYLLLSVFLMLFVNGYGQVFQSESGFKLCVNGGGALNTYFGKDISGNSPLLTSYYGLRIGYDFLPSIGIETGYGRTNLCTVENNSFIKITNTSMYHQIPMLFRYNLEKVSFGLGGEVNILQNATIDYSNRYSDDVTDYYRKFLYSGYADIKIAIYDYCSLGISLSYSPQHLLVETFDWTAGSARVYLIINIL